MKKIINALWLSVISVGANASLFFSETSLNLLDEIKSGGGDRQHLDHDDSPTKVKLSSIVYTDKNNWAVWLNDQKLDQHNKNMGRFRIEKVTEEKVNLSYLPQNGTKKVNFELKHGQIYDGGHDKIDTFTIR